MTITFEYTTELSQADIRLAWAAFEEAVGDTHGWMLVDKYTHPTLVARYGFKHSDTRKYIWVAESWAN